MPKNHIPKDFCTTEGLTYMAIQTSVFQMILISTVNFVSNNFPKKLQRTKLIFERLVFELFYLVLEK